jgi:hypothetical protein
LFVCCADISLMYECMYMCVYVCVYAVLT